MKATLKVATTIAAAALCLAAIAAPGAAAQPAASASKGCNVDARAYGHNMYTTSLAVRQTSCRTGRKVIKGYTKCRYKHGGLNGRCPNRVKRYKCGEAKRDLAPHIQYSVKVSCKRGSKRVKFSYTQQV
ncbi:MAG: hypothetical protein ACXWZ3_01850 [Solirubrobacterales bacterium]